MFDLDKVIKQFEEIPFGNSDYQNINYVLNSQFTPERAYRALGLRLMDRLQALKSTQFSIKKSVIDIEEKQWKIANDSSLSSFDIRRLELELEESESGRAYSEKLAKDAIHECNLLYSELEKFPQYTRIQFEQAEKTHYDLRMLRQIQIKDDSLNSLLNSTVDSNFMANALAKQKELGVDTEITQRLGLTTQATGIFMVDTGILKIEEQSNG